MIIYSFLYSIILLAQDEYHISNYSETDLKPLWITLPSTSANNQEKIYIEGLGNYNLSDSFKCLDTVDNMCDYDSLVIAPHWTPILYSPEPSPTIVNASEL